MRLQPNLMKHDYMVNLTDIVRELSTDSNLFINAPRLFTTFDIAFTECCIISLTIIAVSNYTCLKNILKE